MQATGVPIPSAFLVAIPYVLTIVVIAIFASKAAYPAAINIPYLRRAIRKSRRDRGGGRQEPLSSPDVPLGTGRQAVSATRA
jgi:hypothetical protein